MKDSTNFHADCESKPDLARRLNVSTRTIDRWVNMPDGLPVVRIGRLIWFHAPSVDQWLRGRMIVQNPIRPAAVRRVVMRRKPNRSVAA